MRTKHRLLIAFLVLVMLMVLPTAALANKKIYIARISFANELHEVVGSQAYGAGSFGTQPNGSIYFRIQVFGLSDVPGGAHLHGPAGSDANAGVIVSLCGNPAPSILGACTLGADGSLMLEGVILGQHLRGITGAQFFEYLDNGLVYFNVHTPLNPAGEARGQLIPR